MEKQGKGITTQQLKRENEFGTEAGAAAAEQLWAGMQRVPELLWVAEVQRVTGLLWVPGMQWEAGMQQVPGLLWVAGMQHEAVMLHVVEMQ